MKTPILTLLLLFVASATNAQIKFNTGSAELDADLNHINVDAKANLSLFKTDLSAEFSVSTRKIDGMLAINMEPGEVYLALEIASITGKPIDDVVSCYKSNKTKGWGVIAKEMGIKPGSEEFHQLKGKSKNKSAKGKSSGGSPGNSGKGNSNGNNKKK